MLKGRLTTHDGSRWTSFVDDIPDAVTDGYRAYTYVLHGSVDPDYGHCQLITFAHFLRHSVQA
jgi:hypothetical protein